MTATGLTLVLVMLLIAHVFDIVDAVIPHWFNVILGTVFLCGVMMMCAGIVIFIYKVMP